MWNRLCSFAFIPLNTPTIAFVAFLLPNLVALKAINPFHLSGSPLETLFCIRLIYLAMYLVVAVGVLERKSRIGAMCVLLFLLIILTDKSLGVNQNELREWKKIWYKTELQITWFQRTSACRSWKRIRSGHCGNEPPW